MGVVVWDARGVTKPRVAGTRAEVQAAGARKATRTRRWARRRRSRVATWASRILLGVFIGVVALAVLYVLPGTFIGDGGGLSAAERSEALMNERRTLITALAAVGAGIGLYYTAKRHELDRDANRTDRYTKAVEQLGHDSIHIRLGGVYALERTAWDSPDDAPVIANVLLAFVIEESKATQHDRELPDEPAPSPGPRTQHGETIPRADVAAALGVLTGGQIAGDTLRLTGVDLSDATLVDIDLDGAELTRANLTHANLAHARLREAELADATLTGADLSGAKLNEAFMARAQLNDANLDRADLTGADLTSALLHFAVLTRAALTDAMLWRCEVRGAFLDEAKMDGANLDNADLRSAKLRGARLVKATLRDAWLNDADLSGADLSGADLTGAILTGANLMGANLTDVLGADLTGAVRS